MTDIVEKCTEYLSSGGLFNPEMMEHDKVRDLIIECRDEIEQLRVDLNEYELDLNRFQRALKIAAGLISTMNGYTDAHPQEVYNWLLVEGSVNE